MSLSEQASIIGEPSGEHVRIETDGRTIRPYFALPAPLVDECKLQVTDVGLKITAVDPANVGMVSATIYADAFDAYEAAGETPFMIGLTIGQLRKQLRNARLGKSTNDPVGLSIDGTRTRVEITRGYDATTVERADEFLNLDPDAIREEPSIPDLELEGSATINTQAFGDVVEACDSVSDHLRVTDDGDDLLIEAGEKNSDGIERGTVARFLDAVEASHDGEGSKFSIDYVSDFADALQSAKIDDVELVYDEEFPMRLKFERDGEDGALYDGQFFIAPRISKEDDV